jgi:hypothetical protein
MRLNVGQESNPQSTYMRTVGIILSLLCTLISIVLLLIAYVCIFDDYQVIPDFESTPREGWEYWMRIEYWHDVRSFALWILLALGGVIIPTCGHIRSEISISERKVTDWILFGISGFYLVFWSWALVIRLSLIRLPELDWILIPPSIMFAGCLYGLLVFWNRARFRIDEEAQQVVDGKPPEAPQPPR